ncbi:alcohol dehydrogenase-like regulatory protein ErcA [Mesoterricola silvestris]|uniref:Iron-containing alcohol dehydrogenase n=1 Tax=Mesoterricola silvestris TaxID=2927979 RepID=A0AA48H064_9BACT|nr:alcohol dehydrogenase-like regulatory protein ErcA [Mesoterricola silvestris]BDU73603.1 iron-containing alcohol dehydrogenase [Mesoterricola silvestris]
MSELRKFVAPEFLFGLDARKLLGRYARNLGARRVLLVSDPGVDAAGWTNEAAGFLQEEGLEVTRYLDVSPNPRSGEVAGGVAVYRSSGSDLIAAVGGGSAMDCAKGIGIVATNGGSILDYEGVDEVRIPMPPLLCVPTTAGSSADVSQFAIINDADERVKIAIISKAVVPDVALIDPRTLLTLNPFLTACTGLDALVHAIEAFVSNANSAVTDVHALEAMRLVAAHLEASVGEPEDLERRTCIMQASLHAGLAFSNASLGAVHAMAHSLGGFKDLPHGECNALLLAHVIDFNFPAAPERFRRVAEALGAHPRGLPDAQVRSALVDRILALRTACGIKGGLASRGISAGDAPHLASKAFDDPCVATNPREPSPGDLEALFLEAL